MTFVEAAVQILRREGKPLHVKELTRLAIKHNLLSVVGRDPEAMMETRLLIEAKRPSADLVRVSPGVFGLRVYPPRSERGDALKAEGEKVTKPKAESAATPAKDPRAGKRRRTGRGSENAEATAAAPPAETAEPAKTPAAVEPVSSSPNADPPKAKSDSAPDAARPAAKSRRRTRDRGAEPRTVAPTAEPAASSPAIPTVVAAEVTPPAPSAVSPVQVAISATPTMPTEPATTPASVPAPSTQSPAPVAVQAVPPPAAVASIQAAKEPVPSVQSPAPSAKSPAPSAKSPAPSAKSPAPSAKSPTPAVPPIAPVSADVTPTRSTPAPSAGTPQPTRPPEVTTPPRSEANYQRPSTLMPAGITEKPPGSPARIARQPRVKIRAAAPREDRPAPSASTPAPGTQAPAQPQQPRVMTMADAAYDVLRGASDGRALTNRQIAEIAVKRRLVRGELADVARSMRVALVREQRHRDSEGLRPRIRNVGPGQYALGERKLEPELYNAERELLDRAGRTREATRVALRRRLRQLPAGAFELLMKLLLERLGMVGAEIVKRGEGVAYYGGVLTRGSRTIKVLVAIRPGEGELSKEAVGEIRAGVRLRGFDEGLILCSARAAAAAQAEVAAGPGIELYDQDALTELLIRHHLGVRRMHLPVDYLDSELFTELLDQG